MNANVTLTASSISLSAQSTTAASIAAPVHSHGLFNTSDLISASITTENTAMVTLDGALSSSGAVSVTTSVNVTDTVNAAGTDGENLTAVTVTPTDTSEVLLGSAAAISGGSVDLGAATHVAVNITADHLADSLLSLTSGIIPSSVTGTLVEIQTQVTNTTKVVVPVNAAAMIVQTGTGTVQGGTESVLLSATDTTNVTTALTTPAATYLPLLNGALLFSTVDSAVTLNRATEVLVGDVNPLDTLTSASIPATTPSGRPACRLCSLRAAAASTMSRPRTGRLGGEHRRLERQSPAT